MRKHYSASGRDVGLMRVKAFVLIQTEIEVARTDEVAAVLKKLGQLKSVDRVTGPYDIIVEIEAETLEEIGALVDEKIRTVAGIYRTVTCVAI